MLCGSCRSGCLREEEMPNLHTHCYCIRLMEDLLALLQIHEGTMVLGRHDAG
jgi:hypothetical protein